MTKILHCDRPECPRDWEKLSPTGESHIRSCTECMKAVYLCETEDEVRHRVEAEQRAAKSE